MKVAKLLVVIGVVVLIGVPAFANKAGVEIKVPADAKKGTEVTITINVSHWGNSSTHFVDWVWVKADGKEIARWEFTSDKLPEGGSFKQEVKVIIDADTVIESQANCNLHGSTGAKSKTIKLRK